uniref:BTB domain-containing protein n=1 Tax=Panagrolaimus superbus TaxID=310955 RepID=A0A914YYT1_9BILA
MSTSTSSDASATAAAADAAPLIKEVKFCETWKINKMAFRNVRKIESDIFTTEKEKINFSFIMNPKHRTDKEKMHFYMYVDVPAGKNVDADYTFSCETYSKRFIYSYLQSGLRGSNCFSKINYERKYIKDGWMKIKITGTFKIKDAAAAPPPSADGGIIPVVVAKETTSPRVSLPSLTLDDSTIKFFPPHDFILIAHKSILRQHMTSFDTVFNLESSEHKINDLSFDIVEAAVGFCYGQEIHNFDTAKLIELFKFCRVYGMAELKDIVEHKMSTTINTANVIYLANNSLRIFADDLHERCIEFLHANFSCKGIDFKALDKSLKAELFDRSLTEQ